MIRIVPDTGPLITLAHADALDTLLVLGWQVEVVDMVVHEVTRHQTPTSTKLADFFNSHKLPIIKTQVFSVYQQQPLLPKSGLGELAIQEYMHDMALCHPKDTAVFLFEDHKIAKASFNVPANVRKISTRAFLLFLEREGLISSAKEIEQAAIQSGRSFSQLRCP